MAALFSCHHAPPQVCWARLWPSHSRTWGVTQPKQPFAFAHVGRLRLMRKARSPFTYCHRPRCVRVLLSVPRWLCIRHSPWPHGWQHIQPDGALEGASDFLAKISGKYADELTVELSPMSVRYIILHFRSAKAGAFSNELYLDTFGGVSVSTLAPCLLGCSGSHNRALVCCVLLLLLCVDW